MKLVIHAEDIRVTFSVACHRCVKLVAFYSERKLGEKQARRMQAPGESLAGMNLTAMIAVVTDVTETAEMTIGKTVSSEALLESRMMVN